MPVVRRGTEKRADIIVICMVVVDVGSHRPVDRSGTASAVLSFGGSLVRVTTARVTMPSSLKRYARQAARAPERRHG